MLNVPSLPHGSATTRSTAEAQLAGEAQCGSVVLEIDPLNTVARALRTSHV